MNQNRMLRAKQAFDLGIADALFEPADFLERSLAWASAVVSGEIVVDRPEVDRGEAWTRRWPAARASRTCGCTARHRRRTGRSS